MSEFTKPSYNIPAFGGWNYGDGFPITQGFHSARAAGFLRYTPGAGVDRDLYRGSGDLYCDQGNNAAVAVISSPKKQKSWTYDKVQSWNTSGGQQVGQVATFPRPPKAVDEDLYRISPHQLQYSTSTRKKMLSLFSRCLEPSCRE